jgi:hypothetical protein
VSDPKQESPGPRPRGSRLDLVRGLLLAGLLAFVVGYFYKVVDKHYPVVDWLFWRYAGYAGLAFGWSAACLSAGFLAVRRVLGVALPAGEELCLAFAIGVYAFFLAMFAGGLLHLYGVAFFAGLPLVMIAAGAPPLYRHLRRLSRRLRRRAPIPLWTFPVALFGAAGVALVYFSILSPENAAEGARWQHLALAEHYAAEGAVRRFPEGWYAGAAPHLASFLYTWAFLLPRSAIFDRVELCAHLEFAVFVATLASIPVLVRRLVPARHAGSTWVVLFLFPGVFLYDSSLCLGADHVAALFAVPIYLALLRAYRDLAPRITGLLALLLAAAFLTGYESAVLLVGFPIAVLVARVAGIGLPQIAPRVRRAEAGAARAPIPRGVYLAPLAAIAVGIVATAPHWLKNWVWYGDPLYPVLHDVLTLRPWTADSAVRLDHAFETQPFRSAHDWNGVVGSLKALYAYSFVPSDPGEFHGKVPVFGSLFTLLALCLPWIGWSGGPAAVPARGRAVRVRRLWGIYAGVHVAIFLWYWTHHQDRYLQTILPWMTAATAAVMILVWRSGAFARAALSALVALQIIWGGDVYFIRGHSMIKSAVTTSIALITRGHERQYAERFKVFAAFADAGAGLPRGSKMLVHDTHAHLGLGTMSVSDAALDQGGISYGRLRSRREVFALLSGFRVTHVLWSPTTTGALDTLAGDLRFQDFVSHALVGPKQVGTETVARMPPAPPAAEGGPDLAFVVACPRTGRYQGGLYRVADMLAQPWGAGAGAFPAPLRAGTLAEAPALLEHASFAAVEVGCGGDLPADARKAFTVATRRPDYEVLLRASGSPTPP